MSHLFNCKTLLFCAMVVTVLSVSLTGCGSGDLSDDDSEENVDNSNELVCADGQRLPIPTLELQQTFGEAENVEVRTSGIWAIWWDNRFNHEADVLPMVNQLNEVRCNAILSLQMQDPPNLGRGVYYNVYIHHGEADRFPNGWGNGQGTDSFGNPFLTLPNGAHLDIGNLNHEGFHVFQYQANSPGFAYQGDSQWYIETTANWYDVKQVDDNPTSFIEVGAIDGNPQLTLWHSFSNEAPGDPTTWPYQVRQYGMHSFLYYLTEHANFDSSVITSGFYARTELLPQEYLYSQYGPEIFRSGFADWAAHNTADFDYLTRAQVDRARQEFAFFAAETDYNQVVAEYTNVGTEGQSLTPPEDLRPRSWSYNVIKVNNSENTSYTFGVTAEANGSEGAAAVFKARIVKVGLAATEFIPFDLVNDLTGTITVQASADTSEIYLVLASVPAYFRGNQTYNYTYQIEKD